MRRVLLCCAVLCCGLGLLQVLFSDVVLIIWDAFWQAFESLAGAWEGRGSAWGRENEKIQSFKAVPAVIGRSLIPFSMLLGNLLLTCLYRVRHVFETSLRGTFWDQNDQAFGRTKVRQSVICQRV